MAESMAARQAQAIAPAPESRATLASLFLTVERQHDRVAVVERRLESGTQATPDWRFHRHVLRLALYLKERCGFEHGDRLVLVAPVGPEWLMLDWATVLQGGTTVVVDPAVPESRLVALLGELAPRVALAQTEVDGARLLELAGGARALERVLVLDGTPQRTGLVSFVEALDLGGTLDTAERANAMRAHARTIGASQIAAVHPGTGESLTNGDVAARVRTRNAGWSATGGSKREGKPRKQAVIVLDEGTPVTPALHVALYGYVADGTTCTAFGARGGQSTEEVRP
jgi:hypothetical protein